MGDEFQLGLQVGRIGKGIDARFSHRGTIFEKDISTQTGSPALRQAVPPVAQCFFLVDFCGIDGGNLDAVVLSVEVDFDIAVFDVVNLLVVDGCSGQVTCQRSLEIDGTIVSRVVGDALKIEFEISVFEEKVDVFEIGLHVFVDGRFAVGVKVVFDLHLVVDKDFAPAFGEDDFLFCRQGSAVAKEVHGFLQIRDHAVDFVFIFCDFVFGKLLLGLCAKGDAKQQ